MDANQQAKREVIGHFFDDAEDRIAFVSELDQTGHRTEAMTLCLTYIDSFSQWLFWRRRESGRNFVEAVIQFGGDRMMGLVHPLQAIQSFERMKGAWPLVAKLVERLFPGPPYELQPIATFENALVNNLTAGSVQPPQLRNETWRATVANTAYQHLRIPSVHAFGYGDGIVFSDTKFEGSLVPSITLPTLLVVLRALVAESRRRSEVNGQWFGDDRIVKGDAGGE